MVEFNTMLYKNIHVLCIYCDQNISTLKIQYQLGTKYSFSKGGGMNRFIVMLTKRRGIGLVSHVHNLLKRD